MNRRSVLHSAIGLLGKSPVRTFAHGGRGMGGRAGMRVLAIAAVLASVGCAGLPHATAEDVQLAQGQYPGATADSLETGRHLYAQRCSGCHPLHLPEEKRPDEWVQVLPEMADNARMKADERVLVERYLVTMSARSTARAAAGSSAGGSGKGSF